MGSRIPIVRRLTGARPANAMEEGDATVRDDPASSGNGVSRPSGSAEDEAVDTAGSGDGAPLAGSLGERHRWLLVRRDEAIVFSRLDTRVQTALRRAGCSTWGDVAVLSEDELRSVPGVGDTTISSLHRDLERGQLGPGRPVHSETVSHVALSEKYGWMADAAGEQIDASLFDTRTLNGLIRGNIRTWGDLGALSDASLLKIRNFGALSVRRLNEALSTYERKAPEPSGISSAATDGVHPACEGDNGIAPTGFDLWASAEWSTLIADDASLGEFLAAIGSEAKVPNAVRREVDELLAVPLSRLAGRAAVPLGELVENLISRAGDPELLEARECVPVKPTLEELGEIQGLTRERIRQKVVADAELVLGLLKEDQFRAVSWAAEQLQAEFGLAIPSGSEIPERWRRRLGERRFEILRWASGYAYKDDWLIQGSSALADLEKALGDAVGDEWLVKANELAGSLRVHVHPEVAVSFLLDNGQWRDIGDGWLIRWDGAIQHKAERVLRLTCRPMTPEELIEAIGHGSARSLKSQYGSTLIRVDKKFRLALPEWEYEEYEGIITEIEQRIDRGGGVASVSAILEEFVPAFGVKEGSVRAYLEAGPYIISGDEVRRLANRGYTPSSVSGRRHAIRIGEDWGQRFTVSEANLRGYSFALDRDIAAHNGLQPEDSLLVPATHSGTVVGEASLIWRMTNIGGTVDVGRLSTVLSGLGLGEGDEVVIVATPESCAVLRESETPQKRRSVVSNDVRRSLLGRN